MVTCDMEHSGARDLELKLTVPQVHDPNLIVVIIQRTREHHSLNERNRWLLRLIEPLNVDGVVAAVYKIQRGRGGRVHRATQLTERHVEQSVQVLSEPNDVSGGQSAVLVVHAIMDKNVTLRRERLGDIEQVVQISHLLGVIDLQNLGVINRAAHVLFDHEMVTHGPLLTEAVIGRVGVGWVHLDV